MFSKTTHDVLTLLAVTVFADKHVYSSEIKEFINVAKTLPHCQNPDDKLSEARLLAWFEQNRLELKSLHASQAFEDWLLSLLERLSGLKDKTSLLQAMRLIARADGEVHISETALITLAKYYWGETKHAA